MTASPSPYGDAGFGVNSSLTPTGSGKATAPKRSRRRPEVENDDYMRFAARIIKAAGRRIATGDVDSLPDLLQLQTELAQALDAAVTGLRDTGYSWGEIASRLGTTRQAAQQRWGTTSSNTGTTGTTSTGSGKPSIFDSDEFELEGS